MSTTAIAPTQPACRGCGAEVPTDAGQCPSCRRFLPGNSAALHHGARAGTQLAAATADALADVDEAIDGGPGSEPRFALARASAAHALARVRLLEEFFDERGLLHS